MSPLTVVNVKIKPARSFEGAHKNSMSLNVFIKVNNHTYISICVYIVFLSKKKSSFTLFFGAFIPWHDSGPTNQLVAPFPPQQMTRLKESQTDPAPHPGPGRPSSPTPSSCSFPLATPTRPLSCAHSVLRHSQNFPYYWNIFRAYNV
jgi:hypothetical protein